MWLSRHFNIWHRSMIVGDCWDLLAYVVITRVQQVYNGQLRGFLDTCLEDIGIYSYSITMV